VPATAVRCCWNDTHLFVRFLCADDDIWGTFSERDDPLYDEEVVEVSLSPSGDLRHYFELELSPRNVVFDARIHSPHLERSTMQTDRDWTCDGLETSVTVEGRLHHSAPADRAEHGPAGRWAAELAIPFESLGLDGPPSPGEMWRVNFYRIDRGQRTAYCAWSPTLRRPADFHVPDRFGTLRFVTTASDAPIEGRWTAARADAWRDQVGWIVGCNFIPSTASNQLEMWQGDTFDVRTIERELEWAASVGMNAVRVYLHDLAWSCDPKGFISRLRRFLSIAAKQRIGVVFVLFDDCWNPEPRIGEQEPPIPGVHNSRWLQSPGAAVVADPLEWTRLRRYVQAVVGALRSDRRVLMWDLYNEPGNSQMGMRSLPLLQAAFAWARQARPTQPLTAGIWADLDELNRFQLANADILTFHNYEDVESLRTQISALAAEGRPIVCTEWMARPTSTIASHLPVFKEAGVGCFMWGLVSGKTQTIYPWGSPGGGPEPTPWFHDLLRPDGTPYDPAEVSVLRALAGRQVRAC
jgi:hypothetical protein